MAKSQHRRPGGFTLIEVLIALAITSMVVSVLMASVFYGSKVQSAIRAELVDREQLLRSKAWFSEMLGSCLPAENTSNAVFIGSEKELACDSLMPLQGRRVLPVQRVHLLLRPGRAQNPQQMQLVYRQGEQTANEQVLLDLPVGTASFSFIGNNGTELAKWPPSQYDIETLPRRIRLKVKPASSEAADFEWTATVRASPWTEPVLKTPFGFGLPR